ncbi:hypothetical protein M9H77_22205 [Catharanthus roseus]|uniref:Uncharacterized protein n=1 Tax=Catharanthus roseus TaxID=4058 RepID=A0ACC0ASD2_CATRO|nr:hypothetical protein M9H77_22205 [Catharanthus roseus]
MANLYIAQSGTLLPVPETRIGDLNIYIPSFNKKVSTTRSLTSLHLSRSLTSLHLDVSGVCMSGSAGKMRDKRVSTSCSTTRLSTSSPFNSTSTPVRYVLPGTVTRRFAAQSTANRYHAPPNDRLHFLRKNNHL